MRGVVNQHQWPSFLAMGAFYHVTALGMQNTPEHDPGMSISWA